MPVAIALRNDLTNFTVKALLDGQTYTLTFRWIPRNAHWIVHVSDEQDVNLLIGDQVVVADYPMAAYFTGREPPGFLIAVDTSGQGIDPGINDLGARVQLQYVTAAEAGA